MRWPFRRNQNIEGVPQEIQDYYQSERRERTGIAWLLALGTLLTTIALAILLFFGGRWVYRKVANRDRGNGTTSQVTQQPNESTTTDDEASQQPNAEQSGGASSGTSSTTTNTPSSTPAAPTSSQSQPQTRASSSNLPNTGPGDVVAVFVLTSLMGTVLHHRLSSKRV